jgi:hypothetical protein
MKSKTPEIRRLVRTLAPPVLMARLNELAATVRAEVDAARSLELGERSSKEERVVKRYRGRPVGCSTAFRMDDFVAPRNAWRDRDKSKPARVDKPAPVARKGEVPMWQWLKIEMQRWNRSKNTIYGWFKQGMYPGVKMRVAGRRFVFMRVPKRVVRPLCAPLPGEILMKDFVSEECAREQVSAPTIYMRVQRGGYSQFQFRRVNKAVVLVSRRMGVGA